MTSHIQLVTLDPGANQWGPHDRQEPANYPKGFHRLGVNQLLSCDSQPLQPLGVSAANPQVPP